jgi:hypothetical protein
LLDEPRIVTRRIVALSIDNHRTVCHGGPPSHLGYSNIPERIPEKWIGRGVVGGHGSIPSLRLACPDEWPTEMGIRKVHSERVTG